MGSHPLNRYIPVADAIAQLFRPVAEVVIHDIAGDAVFYIANPVSGRQPGDRSLLKLAGRDLDNEGPVIGPYEKAGDKGQRIRAITAVLRDEGDDAVGLLCINLDYSAHEHALDLLESLIRPPQESDHPEILFRNDWRDQIKLEIRAFLSDSGGTPDRLTPDIRKQLMARLEGKGLFYAKKSVEQVAAILGVSRATAYNDLNAVRKEESSQVLAGNKRKGDRGI